MNAGAPNLSSALLVQQALACIAYTLDQPLAVKPYTRLTALRDQLQSLCTELCEFESDWLMPAAQVLWPDAVVHAPSEGQIPLADAHGTWSALEPGRYPGGAPEFERLVTQSPTLRALEESGFSINAARRFSEVELAFAKRVGSRADDVHVALAALRRAFSDRKAWVALKRHELSAGAPLFEAFASAMGSAPFLVEHYHYGEKAWQPYSWKRLKRAQGAGKVRVKVADVPTSWRSFANGHWFTAFAYLILDEHLAALNKDFELLSLVDFTAPMEFGGRSGDFDVLARTAGMLLLVECKSGRLDVDRGDFEQIVAKAEAVEAVLDRTGAQIAPHSVLLYNPRSNRARDVEAALEGTCVVPLVARDLRRYVREVVR